MRKLRWLVPAVLLLDVSAQTVIRLRNGPLPENILEQGAAKDAFKAMRRATEESAERIHLLARFGRD
jgi:hypothetical protein